MDESPLHAAWEMPGTERVPRTGTPVHAETSREAAGRDGRVLCPDIRLHRWTRLSQVTAGTPCQRHCESLYAKSRFSGRGGLSLRLRVRSELSFATRHGGNMASGPSPFPSLLPQDQHRLRAPPPGPASPAGSLPSTITRGCSGLDALGFLPLRGFFFCSLAALTLLGTAGGSPRGTSASFSAAGSCWPAGGTLLDCSKWPNRCSAGQGSKSIRQGVRSQPPFCLFLILFANSVPSAQANKLYFFCFENDSISTAPNTTTILKRQLGDRSRAVCKITHSFVKTKSMGTRV